MFIQIKYGAVIYLKPASPLLVSLVTQLTVTLQYHWPWLWCSTIVYYDKHYCLWRSTIVYCQIGFHFALHKYCMLPSYLSYHCYTIVWRFMFVTPQLYVINVFYHLKSHSTIQSGGFFSYLLLPPRREEGISILYILPEAGATLVHWRTWLGKRYNVCTEAQ